MGHATILTHRVAVLTLAALTAVALTSILGASLVSAAGKKDVLKVCADPNYLPFSNNDGEGFENRVAELLAADLGIPVVYSWFPQRMGFIRNTLRVELDDGTHKCDLVMGVPDDFELVITTKPYYRSTYALVYVKGRGLDAIRSISDLLQLDESRKGMLRFGIAERNPGTLWLAKHGLLDRLTTAYASQLGDPEIGPGELEYRDLVQDRIDLTIMWGPIAGHFEGHADGVELAVIPMLSEPGVKLDFAISVGVRFGEREWRDTIQTLLDRHAVEITELLREYGVPIIGEDGALFP